MDTTPPMRSFEVTVPTRGRGLAITLELDAPNWHSALDKSIEELESAEVFFGGHAFDLAPGASIDVHDVASGRHYRITRRDGAAAGVRPGGLSGMRVEVGNPRAGVGSVELDPQNIATQPELPPASPVPIVRARGLHRVPVDAGPARPRSKGRRRPASEAFPQTYRPVVPLQHASPPRLVDEALHMLAEHIGCESALLLEAEAERGFRVLDAVGPLAESLVGKHLELFAELREALGADSRATLLEELATSLSVCADNDETPVRTCSARQLIWVRLEDGRAAVLVNSTRPTGFSPSELAGARYLGETVAGQLATSKRSGRQRAETLPTGPVPV